MVSRLKSVSYTHLKNGKDEASCGISINGLYYVQSVTLEHPDFCLLYTSVVDGGKVQNLTVAGSVSSEAKDAHVGGIVGLSLIHISLVYGLQAQSRGGARIFERNNVKKDAVRRPLSYPKNGTKMFAKEHTLRKLSKFNRITVYTSRFSVSTTSSNFRLFLA